MAKDEWSQFLPASDDWSGFLTPEQYSSQEKALDTVFDDTGLGFLDEILGGGVRQQTQRNQADPFFDPSIYDARQNYLDQLDARQREQNRIRSERERLIAEDEAQGEGFPELGVGTRAGLGVAQGLYGLGRAVGGALQALPGETPVTEAGRTVSQYWGDKAQELAEITDIPRASKVEQFAGLFAQGATSILPSLAAAPAGLAAMALTAGGQVFGGVYADATDAYEAQGFDRRTASRKAYFPATLSGLLTATLTGTFGRTGVEALANGLSGQSVKAMLRDLPREIVSEFSEEGLDELGQGIVAQMTFDPNRTIDQIIQDSVLAATVGGALGGTVGGVRAAASVRRDQQTQQQPVPEPQPDEFAGFEPAAQEIDFQEYIFDRDIPQAPRDPQEGVTIDINQPIVPRVRRGSRVGKLPEGELMAPAPAGVAALPEAQARQIQDQPKPGEIVVERFQDGIRVAGLTVPKDQRGKGEGTRLMQQVIEESEATGKPIYLTASPESQEKQADLNRFYERMGFVQRGSDPLNGQPMYVRQPTIQPQQIEGGDPVSEETSQGVQVPPVQEEVAPVKTGTKGPPITVKPRPDGIYDILDAIQELGGITTPRGYRWAGKGEYDGFKAAFGEGAARLLIRRSGGQRPDLLKDELSSMGFHFETESDLYDAVTRAVKERDALRKSPDKTEDFLNAALENKGKGATHKGTESIPTDALNPGDKFNIKGQGFEVTHVDPDDGTVTVLDGPKYKTQTLPAGVPVYPDKKSFEPVPAQSVDEIWNIDYETEPSTQARIVPPVAPEPARPSAIKSGLGGSISPGAKRSGGERIVTARPQLTARVDASAVPESIARNLSEHQQQGVAKAIQAMDNAARGGGFLIADGTGVGKTREALAVAEYYRAQGKPVVIVTKAEVIKVDWKKGAISGSFKNDSEAMGVPIVLKKDGNPDVGEIAITTYENIDMVNNWMTGDTVLILDESHALKNTDSKRTMAGMEAVKKAEKVLFMSATPADKVQHIHYLDRIGILEGSDVETAYQRLGLQKITKEVGKGPRKKEVVFWQVDPKVGALQVKANFDALFGRMTKAGAMVKREISMDGVSVEIRKLDLPPEAHADIEKIANFFDVAEAEDAQGLLKARILMHQRRQQEPYKIPATVQMVKEELAAGRKVVVFLSRVNESAVQRKIKTFDAFGNMDERIEELMRSEGTAKSLKQALLKAGIKESEIVELHGSAEDKAPAAMAKFQDGPARVMVATIESGGTGINLDDTVGDSPRTMVVMTAPFSAVENVQAAGRIWRLMTKGNAKIRYLFGDTAVDDWNRDIIGTKMKTLGATVSGQVGRLDVAEPDTAEYTPEKAAVPHSDPGLFPALAWKEFKTKKGNIRFVAPASESFWNWYNANKDKAREMGVSVSKWDNKWQVWSNQPIQSESTPAPEPQPATPEQAREARELLNQLREKETLTPDDYRRLELLEQKIGQTFIPGTEPAPDTTQGDLLGNIDPEAEEVRGKISDDQGVLTAQGVEEIRNLINQSEVLQPKAKKAFLAMLETPALRNLDWSRLAVAIRRGDQKGFTAYVVGNMITLTEKSTADDFTHELFHMFWDFLPPEYRASVEKARLKTLGKVFGKNIPESLLDGQMTSEEYVALPKETRQQLPYHLINSGEFLSTLAGNEFARSFENKSFLKQLKEWLDEIFEAITRALGVSPSMRRIYNEIIAGRHQPNFETGVQYERDLKGSFAPTARQAQNIETAATGTPQQQLEANELLGQSHDLAESFTRNGAGTVSLAAQRILDYFKWLGIQASGIRLNNGVAEGYRAIKGRLTSPFELNELARVAAVQARDAEVHLQRVIADGQKAESEKSSPSFMRRKLRRDNLKNLADSESALNKAADAIFESVHKQTLKAMKQEGLNDLEIARLEGELRSIDDARKSSSAMSQLTRQMVAVLNSTEDGQRALSDPNFATRQDIIDLYKDLARSTGKTLHNDTLIRWASYLLQKNAELKDTLWAAELARDSNIRKGMGAYEVKFLSDYERDRLGTIRREINRKARSTRKEERAKFAWQMLNKEVLAEESALDSRIEAGEVAQKVLADPQWKEHVQEVFSDVGVKQVSDLGDLFEVSADDDGKVKPNFIVLPSGESVVVDTRQMTGSQSFLNSVRPKWIQAANELKAWLEDPDNFNHPDFEGHRRNYTLLEEYYLTHTALSPNDSSQVFRTVFTIIRSAIRFAGGRVGALSEKALADWERVKFEASKWMDRESKKMTAIRNIAMKSYGLSWKKINDPSWIQSNNWYFDQVFNPLAYANSRPGRKLKAGDRLPTGQIVTQGALDDLKAQAEAFRKTEQILKDNQRTKDTLGENPFYRRMLQASEDMVPRTFNFDLQAFAGGADGFVENWNRWRQTEDGTPEKDEALTNLATILNRWWDSTMKAYVQYRDLDYVKKNVTPFDGAGGAFEIVGQRMAGNPNYAADFDSLVQELASFSALSPDEVQTTILNDFGRMVDTWYDMANAESQGVLELPTGKEPRNATTRSRNELVAPPTFYEYGFRGQRRMAGHAAAIHSVGRQQLADALARLKLDLERQQNEFSARVRELTARGVPNAQKKAITQQEAERRNGQSFDNWDDLEKRIDRVSGVLEWIRTKDPDQETERTLPRSIRAVASSLIANTVTTIRNLTPMFISNVTKGFGMGLMERNLGAVWAVWVDGLIGRVNGPNAGLGMGPSFVISGVKSTGFAFVDTFRAVAQLATGNDRSAGRFFNTAGRRIVQEFGENIYRRVKTIADSMDRGDIHVPDFVHEFDALTLGSLLYRGTLQEDEFSTGKKLLQAPASILEAASFFLRMVFPTVADVTQNNAVIQLMKSSIGPVASLDKKLREVFTQIDRGAIPYNDADPRDPLNVIPENMLMGDIISRFKPFRKAEAEMTMNNIRKLFQGAGLDFDRLAWEFRQQWKKDPKTAKFMTIEQVDALSFHVINWVNRPSGGGRPTAFQTNDRWWNVFAPFMSWPSATLANMNELIAPPVRSKHSRWMQRGAMITRYVLPFILLSALLYRPAEEEGARLVKSMLHETESSTRQWWERDGTKSQTVGVVVDGARAFPIIEIAVNAALNDLPSRASLEPNLMALNKLSDILRYFGGAVQTGDWTYKLPEFVGGLIPESRTVFNRLESESGKRTVRNAEALMRRHGDVDLLRSFGSSSAGVNATELTPYGPEMANAIGNGDMGEFLRIYEEAVRTAESIGKEESVVKSMLRYQNPYSKVFKQKLTEDQYNSFLAKLDASERAMVQEVERNFEQAFQMVDANFTTFKDEGGTPGFGGAGASTRRYPGMPGSSRGRTSIRGRSIGTRRGGR